MSQFSENLGEYFIKNPILKSNPILLVKKPYNNSSRWNINLGKMHKWWKMNETSITIQFAIVHPAINHKLPYITAEQFLLLNTKIGPRFFFSNFLMHLLKFFITNALFRYYVKWKKEFTTYFKITKVSQGKCKGACLLSSP